MPGLLSRAMPELLPGVSLTAPIIAAVVALLTTLGVAFWLSRLQRERFVFGAILAAPLAAGLAFVLVGARPAPAPAAAAETTSTQASAPAAAPAGPQTPAAPAPAVAGNGVVDGLRHDAEELRRTKHYAEAREIYAKIAKAAPFDADAWADLGDAAAAAAGGNLKAGLQAIDRALQIDRNNPKALWLKASLELQEKRYPSAMELWQRLLSQLPKDSNDAQIVSANLEESRSLAAQQGAGR